MAQQTINVGTSPNDGTGTPLRTAFQYTNSNFSELYTAVGPSGNNIVVPGTATITGDLTVDTSTLKVDSTNNRVGINNASPTVALDMTVSGGAGNVNAFRLFRNTDTLNDSISILFATNTRTSQIRHIQPGGGIGTLCFDVQGNEQYRIGSGEFYWYDGAGGTRMTLNSTGLGVGTTDTTNGRLNIRAGTAATGNSAFFSNNDGTYNPYLQIQHSSSGIKLYTNSSFGGDAGNLTIGCGGATNALIVNGSGNVGVGVTPSAWNTVKAIQVGYGSIYGLASSELGIQQNAYYSSGWKYIANGLAAQLQLDGTIFKFQAATNNTSGAGASLAWTTPMTLDASGNLLVGTTSASNQERLNITSNRNVYISRFFNSASSGGNYGFLINYSAAAPNNASNEFLACSDNAASRLFLYSNGGIANYQANDANLSDIRTKTDIKPLASYWNKIKALELVTFKYKDQTHSDDNIGLIAQQVESVAPEFIDADGFGETPSDGVPLKTIYTTDLYHASIKALQEAMARIEALEAKLA
jgi:hypothetical protein